MKIEIIPLSPHYKENFKILNKTWLEKYFYVEPHDEEVLGNPEKYITTPGGNIFLLIKEKKSSEPLP